MGTFNALALLLQPLSTFVKFNNLLLHNRNTFFGFTPCDQ